MKTILLATDLTPKTVPALHWARLFGRLYPDATLILLHVAPVLLSTNPFPSVGDMGVGSFTTPDMPDTERPALEKLADSIRADGLTVRVETRVGNVEDQILAVAADQQADLIVTGRSHPLDFFDRLVGTAATSVARLAPCPVLVVPEDTTHDEPVRLTRVVLASQLQGDDEGVLGRVTEWLKAAGASLELVRVHAENQPTIFGDDTFLNEFQQEYGDKKLTVKTIESRTVTGGLLDYLEQHPADLLVMTLRHHDLLEQLLNPSLTERMIRRTTLPILVYHSAR